MNASAGQPALAPIAPTGVAQLTNMTLALKTFYDCEDAGSSLPRIGIIYGPSGYGKTVATAYVAQRTGAAYLLARSIWTQLSLLQAIAEELGISALERSAPRILEQVIDQLNRDPRALILDEMDHLIRRQHVEIIRDIHDATTVPIILVGEEALPQKLKHWERFHNRVLVATPAQPASLDDAHKLRALYCPRVEIADDLVAAIVTACRGVTRRIVVNLKTAERLGMEDAAPRIDLAWWADRPFQTGDVPARRLAA